ncbi:hypothetical protein [Clostridium sp.]|uniref:hypothetical protein n=1 Tax=Clostridium sp. TaxID=1506 RepID=UPI003F402361
MKVYISHLDDRNNKELVANTIKDIIGATCLASYGAFQGSWIRFAMIIIGYVVIRTNIEID